MLTFNLKTTFFTVKTSNEVYCCRIYFVNYIQNVHIINRTLHGSLEDMDFMFSWQEQYLTRSLRSLVRYCSCHSNIKSISSRNRVISYIYYTSNSNCPIKKLNLHHVNVRFFTGFHSKPRVLRVPWYIFSIPRQHACVPRVAVVY